jgi:hypothetical protein
VDAIASYETAWTPFNIEIGMRPRPRSTRSIRRGYESTTKTSGVMGALQSGRTRFDPDVIEERHPRGHEYGSIS